MITDSIFLIPHQAHRSIGGCCTLLHLEAYNTKKSPTCSPWNGRSTRLDGDGYPTFFDGKNQVKSGKIPDLFPISGETWQYYGDILLESSGYLQ